MTPPSPATADRAVRAGMAAAVQRNALDPAASIWVAASAGTGKTKVLTDRVLSLLLAGTAPERILCLTFTRAAAAEMANRLSQRLMGWATESDGEVESRLATLLGRPPSRQELKRARALFARVLDSPGGMKIATIHAFCQSLLGRFPLEAGVAPHFRLLEELGARERLAEAREEVLALAGSGHEPELAAALATVTARLDEGRFAERLSELVAERGRLMRLMRQAGGRRGLLEVLRRRLGLPAGETRATLEAAACGEGAFARAELTAAVVALSQGLKSDRDRALRIAAWLEGPATAREAGLPDYRRAFLTLEGEPRRKLATSGVLERLPRIVEILAREQSRLLALAERCNAAEIWASTAALLCLGEAVLERYQRRKEAAALLDYDDLVLKTRELLERPAIAPWVLYKLDGGLDHLLIDEAQDTNPDQWEVARLISEEFFSGESAHEARSSVLPRTVFAVGDAKQSIYSFQRADPREFQKMRAYFERRARQARQRFATVDLTHSFRSTGAVLSAVDAVFARPEVHSGVALDGRWLNHSPVRVGQAGLVELWPSVEPESERQSAPWAPPVARSGGSLPRTRLARLLATRIAAWTQAEDPRPGDPAWLESKGRPLRPGDILVLVRRRNALVEELVRELKNRQVPVAGVDRMVLVEQLAVMDLIALGQVLLLPEDDLTLATVLRSPLFGFDEESLFRLAHHRESPRPGSLWAALRASAEPICREAVARLVALARRAESVPPFEFYADLLAKGGRRALLGRLGPEAADPLELFLARALAYGREATPSLQGFLHWIAAGEQEVKRDMELGGEAVRIMTVHGAKGLQAPLVILPDTLEMPQPDGSLFWLPAEAGNEGTPLWSPRSGLDDPLAAAARLARRRLQEEEYRRLLYVALTRAEDRLYVCGWNTSRKARDGCWYSLVAEALEPIAETVAFDFTGEIEEGWRGQGLRLSEPQGSAPEASEAVSAAEALAPLPPWAVESAPAESAVPRPLAPSRPKVAEPAILSPLPEPGGGAVRALGLRRGRLVHRLLQSLPDLPPQARAEAGRRFLAAPLNGLSEPEAEAILQETLAVLEVSAFAPLFGPGSRAEVPVVGLVETREGPEIISGQIDRLYVDREQVLILDFKTERPAPRDPAEVPPAYLRQLAAYRALLAGSFPDRRLSTAILWTEGPRLMSIADELLCPFLP